MARVTMNLICDAIAKKYNVDRKFLSMDKFEGTYHWNGELSCLLSATEMNTHIVRLNDWTLERWIESFDYRIEQEQEQGNLLYERDLADLNQIIIDIFEIGEHEFN